jgi:hypothetical protein
MERVDGLYFYRTEEQKPVYFTPVYFTDSNTWTMGVFIVHCPASEYSKDNEDKIKRLLDRYKFAGTRYKTVFDR